MDLRLAIDRLELVVAGMALWVLPLVGVLLVLLTGLKATGAIVFVALPLASAVLAYLLSRALSTSLARSLLWGFACLVSCIVCNGCALLLAALAGSLTF